MRRTRNGLYPSRGGTICGGNQKQSPCGCVHRKNFFPTKRYERYPKTGDEAEGKNQKYLASPEYVAVMLCEPAHNVFKEMDAVPDEVMFATPKMLVPSEKVTVPVAPGLRVAVKTTFVPKTEGLIEEAIVIVAASP